jgi:hypothetical protein
LNQYTGIGTKIVISTVLKNYTDWTNMEKEVKVEKSAPSAPNKLGGYKGKYKPASAASAVEPPKFEGKCDSLKGYVFDCVDGQQSDRYNVTIKEVAQYIDREYLYGGVVRWKIKNEKRCKVPMPEDLTDDTMATKKRVWERHIDESFKCDNYPMDNLETAFSLVMVKCTEFMWAKLDGLKGYRAIKDSFNLIDLIKAIKGLTYQFEGQRYHAMALRQAKKSCYTLHQGLDTNDTHYLDKFMTRVSVVEQYGGSIGKKNGAIRAELTLAGIPDAATATPAQKIDAAKAAKDKCLAVAFLFAI